MIAVTRLDGTPMLLNLDLIVTIERTPDTVISLSNGDTVLVLEAPDELMSRIVDFKRTVSRLCALHDLPSSWS